MIPQNFEYTAPASLDDALRLLATGEAKPLSGGMSLIPMMKLRFAAPSHLVDLGRIPELNYIREVDGRVRIGATATHHQIEDSPLLRGKCPLLAECAAQIGDVQVRNVGTIGGAAAHADPAADYPAALIALGAEIRLRNTQGERGVPAEEFFVDVLTTALEPGEIVSEIVVPVDGSAVGTRYQKVPHPASGYAMVGIAVRIMRHEGVIGMIRVGVTGVTGKAYRAHAVEQALEGRAGTAEDVKAAAALVVEGVDANSDLAASAEYRAHLARVHTARALTIALQRIA
jgi:carbon-monoxide dehydrogenase medium subunit